MRVPPDLNEIEISIFGAGVGECILVNLGWGDWMAIDSCLTSRSDSTPIAISYLRQIGAKIETSLKIIIVSHWHDDHIEGAAELVKLASDAKFICPGVLHAKEFFNVLRTTESSLNFGKRATKEFNDIFKILKEQGNLDKLFWAWANQRLCTRPESHPICGYEVWSLSPSSGSQMQAFRFFSKLLASIRKRQIRPTSLEPNEFSTVIYVSVGGSNLLLSGDLENSTDTSRGWNAIVMSEGRPKGKCKFFKVPHHGSPNAYCEDVWTELLIPKPIAAVTRFSQGDVSLPSQHDLARLLEKTSELYCTGNPGKWSPPKRRSVDKMISTVAKNRRSIRGATGHIQIRWKIGDELDQIKVRLAAGAMQLLAYNK